jgi:A/G-specific adenine glycosylase
LSTDAFARGLLAWHAHHGRHDLPWQHPRTPYRVWISEVMLQQTQVATVMPYFERFVAALPDVPALAAAPIGQVLALWSGLGYYRRAHHLQAAARECVARHGGALPATFDALLALPGIGRSTAGAILALAHGQRRAILDGNAKRVLCRYHGIAGWPGQPAVEKQLWALAVAHTPDAHTADYTQAIMDLGATVCTRRDPDCAHCPLSAACRAYRDGRVAEIPAARPARTLPSRSVIFVVIRDRRGRVLLELRDAHGVWPGLWSLPEAADAAGADAVLAKVAAGAAGAPATLPAIQHTFTHFRLRATPMAWRGVTPRSGIADADRWRWCAAADVAALGLPAPVRALLARLPA